MAKLRVSQDAAERARRRSPSSGQRKRGLSVAGILIGLLGWAAAGTIGYFLWGMIQGGDAHRADFESQQAALRERQRELQTGAASLNEQLATELNDLNGQIREQGSLHQSLHQEVGLAERRLKEIAQEATEGKMVDTRAADKLAQRQTALQELQRQVQAQRDERQEKEQKKIALIDEYKDRREALKADIREAMERDSLVGVRACYRRYRHTPYAAAAAFYIGEKAIQLKEYPEAERFFNLVVDEYGNSPYRKHAKTRLEELDLPVSRRAFSTIQAGIEPTR